mmetsp:Transcript_96011/g.277263  ORF Transcript_96011/g.277263 Transcript_96011/m.277263 type:complete len:178 (+) Transcript_96011:77-610(+)
MRVVLRNSFLDTVVDDMAALRRCSSAPALRRKDESDAHRRVADQLRRLNSLFVQAQPPPVDDMGAKVGAAAADVAAGGKFAGASSVAVLDSARHPSSVVGERRCRTRPCKEKRERIRRRMAELEARVAADPALFHTAGGLRLPAGLEADARARSRAMAQLAQVAADAYRNLSHAPWH